jgi:activator of HSP90 ATPase
MALHNPNNWHWVSKNASQWTQDWFEKNLTILEAQDGEVTAKISKVLSMDGDVDVSQRKGKVITIFDVKLVLEYSGMCLTLLLRVMRQARVSDRM